MQIGPVELGKLIKRTMLIRRTRPIKLTGPTWPAIVCSAVRQSDAEQTGGVGVAS